LKTAITIRQPQPGDLNRVHQLFTKTNQFNVTTIRYNLGDIENFVENEGFDLLIIEAKDQFGVLGTIGVYLLEKEGRTKYRLDSFILSCRAMGRGIESAIMNHIKKKCFLQRENKNTVITSHFIPTPKNTPVATFFEEQGFKVMENMKSGDKKYRLQKSDAQEVECGWINVLEKEEYDARES
jgi:FkbH-like protein